MRRAFIVALVALAWPGWAMASVSDAPPAAATPTQVSSRHPNVRAPQAPRHEASQAPAAAAPLEVAPGSIVRWSAPGTRRCGMLQRTWRAVQETCYYPIDVERKPGVVTVSRHGLRGSVTRARIAVVAVSFGSETIELGDIPQAHPSRADLRRNAREQTRLSRIWRKPEGPPRFALPLGAPLTPMPDGTGFGAEWHFNTTPPSTETHAGLDYAAKSGTSVAALADGTVVLAEDLFYSGNSVIIDHGNGLFTAYLHLADIAVRVGQAVRRGGSVGRVGETGRATGPHLHLAARWHGFRVNPRLLLQDPAALPAITVR